MAATLDDLTNRILEIAPVHLLRDPQLATELAQTGAGYVPERAEIYGLPPASLQ